MKRRVLSVCIVVMTLLMIGGMIFWNRVWASQETADHIEHLKAGTELQMSRIIIYTYGNEAYVAEGMLNVLQDAGNGKERALELQGSIEKIEHARVNESEIEQIQSEPTVLTIYMEDKIYGFYSNHELKGSGTEENPMIYYGYLEGYVEGDTYYSG